MGETLDQELSGTSHPRTSDHLAKFIPYDLEARLYERIGQEDLVAHKNASPIHSSHQDIETYTAAAVIQFIGQHAHQVKDEFEKGSFKKLRVLPNALALNGLKQFYDQIHETPDQRGVMYQRHVSFLKQHGAPYLDVHVGQALVRQLRASHNTTMFDDESREFLIREVSPEVFAAHSLALRTMRHTPIYKPRPRPIHVWSDDEQFDG